MPNHENISGMLRSAVSTDNVRSHVTHGHSLFDDVQLNRSHQGPDLSLRSNNSTPLETDRGDANGVRRVADCALPPCSGGYLVDGGDKVQLTQTVNRHESRGSATMGRRLMAMALPPWTNYLPSKAIPGMGPIRVVHSTTIFSPLKNLCLWESTELKSILEISTRWMN